MVTGSTAADGSACCRIKGGSMEMGLGIHGEPGAATSDIEPVDALVAQVPAPEPADGAPLLLSVDHISTEDSAIACVILLDSPHKAP